MGYYVVGAPLGQDEAPAGCATVKTELSPGNPYTAWVCPESGCGPNSYRGLAQMFADMGYETPIGASGNPDLRPAWEKFRRDYNFPAAISPNQVPEGSICAELIRVWSGQGGSRTATAERKLSAAAARRVASIRMRPFATTSPTTNTASDTEVATTTPAVAEPGFWEARSTLQKGLIVFGGLAVVSGAVFLFTRKKKP